jgi:hypothetical protein
MTMNLLSENPVKANLITGMVPSRLCNEEVLLPASCCGPQANWHKPKFCLDKKAV